MNQKISSQKKADKILIAFIVLKCADVITLMKEIDSISVFASVGVQSQILIRLMYES